MSTRAVRCNCRCGRSIAVVHPRPAAVSVCGVQAQHASQWAASRPELGVCSPGFSKRSVAAFAWGDDIEFSAASVVATKSEAKDLQLVTVNVGKEVSKGYTKGGQFLQMKVGDSKPAFLAIANAPEASEEGMMEFLIKDVPDTTASMIVKLNEGDEVMVSPVMGKGFPLEKVAAEDFDTMVIFATGSGISPIKALIEAGDLDATERRNVVLFYGAHDADSMAFMPRIPQWELMGVNVVPVFTTRGEGYVQDVYKNAGDSPADPKRTCVLVCGQKEMSEAVYEIVGEQGVSREHCLTNF